MVKYSFFSFVFALSVFVHAESAPVTADELRKMLADKSMKRQSEADRIRASRFDRTSLKLLSNEPIDYVLPNGNTVLGMMLPNGKKSPAQERGGSLHPACVTKYYNLVMGEWNHKTQSIDCRIEASKLAFIDAPQVGIKGKIPEAKTSVKYSDSSVGERYYESSANPSEDSVVSATGSGESVVEINTSKTTSAPPTHSEPRVNPNIYVPPAKVSTRNTSTGISLKVDKAKFGIRRGTWAKAKIERPTTNTESGDMEITLIEPIEGRYKTLPAGTILFASKQFNPANRRLEALTSMGVLPNGDEVDGISAYLFSINKTAGVNGMISRDIEGEIVSAGSNAALGVARGLLPNGGLVINAAREASGEMIDNQRRAGPVKPDAIIRVSPQNVYIKIARAF